MLKAFFNDTSGQFAIVTALVAVPLLLCVAAALEMTQSTQHKRTLQSSLDAAALAAVIPGNMTVADRESYAEKIFYQNFGVTEGVTAKAIASDSRVDVHAEYAPQRIFIDAFKSKRPSIEGRAAAVRTVEDVICVMTLDPSADNSLSFEKDAEFIAPGCSIQVNSSGKKAFNASGSYTPMANSICVVGGAHGNLQKTIKTNCSPVEDPYEGIRFSAPSNCDYSLTSFGSSFGIPETVVMGEQKTLNPGTYCLGLHIYDSQVKLNPGTYIIKDGPLTIGHNSSVVGDGVTFVFTGEDSLLYTYEEVQMDLTAPSSGTFAGLVFFQDKMTGSGNTSIIKGGLNMRLVGTVYFPTQNLFVGGIGEMGASSPALAFIANNITFTSDIEKAVTENEANILALKGYLEMAVFAAAAYGFSDYRPTALASASPLTKKFTTRIQTSLSSHQRGGVPPVLPRSDDGARLISTANGYDPFAQAQ